MRCNFKKKVVLFSKKCAELLIDDLTRAKGPEVKS